MLSGTPSALSTGAEYTVIGTYKNNQGQQVYTLKVGEAVLEVVQISAGGGHTCAVTLAGGVKCWGRGGEGQLGNDGALSNQLAPVDVLGLTSGVASVSAGNSHTCAVTTEGAVKCWGYNAKGQLGDGSTTQKATPIQVSGLSSGVKSISAGSDHTCAVTSTDAAQCWGANSNGQLGNETTVSSLVPVQVSGLTSGVADISAGYGHTCAVTLEGAAKCWGYNGRGQLGDGSTTQKATPIQVSGLSSGVKSISAGSDHTCAVSTAGAAKCWGSNGSGQVGNNSYDNSLYPAQVQGLSQGVTSVKAGAGRACAIGVAGELKCWGENYNGGLGTGSVTNPLRYPLLVNKLPSGVAGVSMGSDFICVVTTSSAAKCWGRNYYGALGNGTTHSAVGSTPTNVLP